MGFTVPSVQTATHVNPRILYILHCQRLLYRKVDRRPVIPCNSLSHLDLEAILISAFVSGSLSQLRHKAWSLLRHRRKLLRSFRLSSSNVFFSPNCPLEIRHMIYRHLLVSGESITHPYRMIGYNETVVKRGNLPCYGIDAGFIQTCRVTYEETMPILYGVNEFQFNSPTDMGSFQRHGLIEQTPNEQTRSNRAPLPTLLTVDQLLRFLTVLTDSLPFFS